jgi:hypothetical protein
MRLNERAKRAKTEIAHNDATRMGSKTQQRTLSATRVGHLHSSRRYRATASRPWLQARSSGVCPSCEPQGHEQNETAHRRNGKARMMSCNRTEMGHERRLG